MGAIIFNTDHTSDRGIQSQMAKIRNNLTFKYLKHFIDFSIVNQGYLKNWSINKY